MKKTTPLLAALGLSLAALSSASLAGEKIWISLGDAALAQLQKHSESARPRLSVSSGLNRSGEFSAASSARRPGLSSGAASTAAAAKPESIHLVQIDEDLLGQLSDSIHEELRRCGGYMFHASLEDGLATLQAHSSEAAKTGGTLGAATGAAAAGRAGGPSRPSYVIDQQARVTPMLAQMQASRIGQTIVDLSSFTNRFYKTSSGVAASNWIKQQWANLGAGRSDFSVVQFNHPNWAQKSVIATIKGSDNSREVIVLGAHMDSINGSNTTETTVAPGADDDASGVASLTEILRTLMANNYKPRRTIQFMAYAAEEVGLRGSQEIAKSHKRLGANVVGVMQLDMTNYKGSPKDIYIYTDYTDAAQNQFVNNLIQTYQPELSIGTDVCGYGCSDHASWTAQGYAASMPFEAAFNQDNPKIHTANDTYANTGSQADHSLKFARLGLSYAVELGSDGPGSSVPSDKVEVLKGRLATGASQVLGPFKAKAGAFKASTIGEGDIDLYVKVGAAPTTSSFDCKSDGSTSVENCAINLSGNSEVYVLLKGYAAGTYKLTVSYQP
ncbi:M20/M25/M40 family metallo-hydrolase [Kinneretia aquatilis]|uniref:M20/M25/M40 family metallo-hydrolase n=1 Tax=Kinneretia aquatilis TaxID=2070761 RepID=UPI0014951CF8|nr:M20/M25/M40 family metallo-hydrolase [Paucibacter aquatile]WIV99482.1 M20/M25/M40 family metallo-hydrolase [Paucibacter aquatile]